MKRLIIVINPSGYRQKEYEFRLIRGILNYSNHAFKTWR